MLDEYEIEDYRANPDSIKDLIYKAIKNQNNFENLRDLAAVYRPTLEKEYVAQFIKKPTKQVPVDPYSLKRFLNVVQLKYTSDFNEDDLIAILIESAKNNDLYFNLKDINKRIEQKIKVVKETTPKESDRTKEETAKNIADLNITADLEQRLKGQGLKLY